MRFVRRMLPDPVIANSDQFESTVFPQIRRIPQTVVIGCPWRNMVVIDRSNDVLAKLSAPHRLRYIKN
jgi:hypothetical protein